MPSVGQVVDVSWAKVPVPNPDATPSFTLPIGGTWQPNDWRIVVFCGSLVNSCADYATSYNSSTGNYTYAPLPMPSGWISLGRGLTVNPQQSGVYVVGHKLVAGDQDKEFSLLVPAGGLQAGQANYSAWIEGGLYGPASIFAFTMRGCDPTFTPLCTVLPNATSVQGPPWQFNTDLTYASRPIGTTPGWEIFVLGVGTGSAQLPSGWTDIWDNGYTFAHAIRPSTMAQSMGLMAKKYSSGASSGTTVFNFPDGLMNFANPPFPAAAGVVFGSGAVTIYFKQAQDVNVSTGTATAETDLANAPTGTLGSSVIVPTGTATAETDLANQAFNQLTGYFIRDPYILGAGPVLDSSIRWVETSVPGRSSVLIETSLDRGATWQTVAKPGDPVPGLRKGDTSVEAVYIRGTISRLTTADAMPKIAAFEPHVSMDAGRTEMVEIFTGQLKTTDVEAGIDAASGGSSGSSAGVVAVGGRTSGGGRVVTLTAVDLSRAIDLAGWNGPYFVDPGTLYTDAGIGMVKNRLPTQTKFDVATTTEVTPLLLYGVNPGSKPFKDIDELFMAIGWWAYFKPDGTFRACPVPDPALGVPVWEYRDNISISNIKKSLTDQDFYNHIIVNGQATSPQTGIQVVPIRAEAVDLDPVTGIYGKAGRRTYEVTLPALTSQAQGQRAADALLLRMKGCPELVTFTIPPNPLLEPGDIITVTAPIVLASGNYVINAFDMPSVSMRGQRVTAFRQSIAS